MFSVLHHNSDLTSFTAPGLCGRQLQHLRPIHTERVYVRRRPSTRVDARLRPSTRVDGRRRT